jgi:hypothetical protein
MSCAASRDTNMIGGARAPVNVAALRTAQFPNSPQHDHARRTPDAM